MGLPGEVLVVRGAGGPRKTATDDDLWARLAEDLGGQGRKIVAAGTVADQGGGGGVAEGHGADDADGKAQARAQQFRQGGQGPSLTLPGSPGSPGDSALHGLVAGDHSRGGGGGIRGVGIGESEKVVASGRGIVQGIGGPTALAPVVAQTGLDGLGIIGRLSCLGRVLVIGGDIPGRHLAPIGQTLVGEGLVLAKEITAGGDVVGEVAAIADEEDQMPDRHWRGRWHGGGFRRA